MTTPERAKGETRAHIVRPPVSPSSRPWRVRMGSFDGIDDAVDRPHKGVGVGCSFPIAGYLVQGLVDVDGRDSGCRLRRRQV